MYTTQICYKRFYERKCGQEMNNFAKTLQNMLRMFENSKYENVQVEHQGSMFLFLYAKYTPLVVFYH